MARASLRFCARERNGSGYRQIWGRDRAETIVKRRAPTVEIEWTINSSECLLYSCYDTRKRFTRAMLRRLRATGKLIVGVLLLTSLATLVLRAEWIIVTTVDETDETVLQVTAHTSMVTDTRQTSSESFYDSSLQRLALRSETATSAKDLQTPTPSEDATSNKYSQSGNDFRDHSPVPANQQENHDHLIQSQNFSIMYNLDKCLSTANLTDYFIQNNLLSNARRNAENFIAVLRRIIPHTFSDKYSSPCWETKLHVNHCDTNTEPACPVQGIRGYLGSLSFMQVNHFLGEPLSTALVSQYPEGLSSTHVCLPKVFLAGFPKCGSSYLFCLLERLSCRLKGSLVKEPRFWVPRGPFNSHQFPLHVTELVPYLLNFQPASEAEINSSISLPIDGSPNLLSQWRYYRRREGITNYCLAPAILPQVLPNSKYIVIMRNPVDMLYSAFWFSCSDHNIHLHRRTQLGMPDLFHRKVLKKIEIFEACVHNAPIDKCMEDIYEKLEESSKYCGRIRLEMGFFYLHIRKWLAVVPREQFLFLTSEELMSHEERVERRIMDFLDITAEYAGEHCSSNNATDRGRDFCNNVQTRYDYHRDPLLRMRNETRHILSAFYKPYKKKLATLLHDEKYLWSL